MDIAISHNCIYVWTNEISIESLPTVIASTHTDVLKSQRVNFLKYHNVPRSKNINKALLSALMTYIVYSIHKG